MQVPQMPPKVCISHGGLHQDESVILVQASTVRNEGLEKHISLTHQKILLWSWYAHTLLKNIAKVFNLRSFVPAREKFCPSWWLRQAKTAQLIPNTSLIQLIPNTSLMRGAISKMGHHKLKKG